MSIIILHGLKFNMNYIILYVLFCNLSCLALSIFRFIHRTHFKSVWYLNAVWYEYTEISMPILLLLRILVTLDLCRSNKSSGNIFIMFLQVLMRISLDNIPIRKIVTIHYENYNHRKLENSLERCINLSCPQQFLISVCSTLVIVRFLLFYFQF